MHTTRTEPSTDSDHRALEAELVRAAKVLRDFYLAELSISALQPVLRLAEDLNEGLRRRAS